MNERIKELAEQSWVSITDGNAKVVDPEKFAELIVKDCKDNFAKVWYEQGLDIRGAEFSKFMTQFDKHFGVE